MPLYLVIAAGVLAYAVPRLLRGESAEDEPEPRRARGCGALLAPSIVLYAVQAAYSTDFERALQNVVFFYVPFALLAALLMRVTWTRELLVRCLGVLVALAVRVRLDRLRRVRHAAAAAQPEGHRLEPVRGRTSASTRCSSTRTSTGASSRS